jgi:hypothetical protein
MIANTLDYYSTKLITAAKSFTAQARVLKVAQDGFRISIQIDFFVFVALILGKRSGSNLSNVICNIRQQPSSAGHHYIKIYFV